jgi:hypothetical protein
MSIPFISHTIDDKIVLDSIKALPAELFVVGGMAVQAHVKTKRPDEIFRTTSDLDTETARRIPYSIFLETVFEPMKSQLDGYTCTAKRGSRAFEVQVVNNETGERLAVHGNRYSEKHYNRSRNMLERELENIKLLNVDGTKSRIAAPEDIIVTKIERLVRNIKNFRVTPAYLSASELNANRVALYDSFDQSEPTDLAKMRADKDVYDIKIMNENIELNPEYLKIAAKDWKRLELLKPAGPIRRKIARFTPPGLIDNL